MNVKKDIQDWWSQKPMTYGETHGETSYKEGAYEIGTMAFFERLDNEFYAWNKPLHKNKPFDLLFPFDRYTSGSKVLEIGCGMGTMAMNWAMHGAKITATDISLKSVEQTKRRFELHNLPGDIHMEDANNLSFQDNAFDYSYSWGVLHHSPDIERSISEMMRVTKDGGGFGIMLYNRRSLWHWYMTLYLEGFLHCEKQFLGPLELCSRYGDGYKEEGNPHTWPVTIEEIKKILVPFSSDVKFKILGTDLDYIFRILLPGLGVVLPRYAKKPWARRFGWSLWTYGHKG